MNSQNINQMNVFPLDTKRTLEYILLHSSYCDLSTHFQHFPFSFCFWSCARNLYKMKPFCILRLAAPWHLGVGELPTQRKNNMKNKQNIFKKSQKEIWTQSAFVNSFSSPLDREHLNWWTLFSWYWKIPNKTLQFSITWTWRKLKVH